MDSSGEMVHASGLTFTESYFPASASVPLVDHTVGGLLAARTAQHPDHLALVGVRHGTGETVHLSYADLYEEASRAAVGISRLASPGDLVALWAPNVVEWVIIEYGAAMAGVVLVALNPVLRRSELEYALAHSQSTVLLHADRSRDYDLAGVVLQAREAFPDLVTVSLSERERWCPSDAPLEQGDRWPGDPDLPVMLQYTSGTTGDPKGVLLTHRSLVNVAKLAVESTGVRQGSVFANPLPMFHTAACALATLGPAWLGGAVVLFERFAADRVLAALRAERVNVLFSVPTVLIGLLEEARADSSPPPKLDVITGGGANVPASIIDAASQVFGADVVNMYGQTELCGTVTATRPGDDRSLLLGTVGRPLPQAALKVVDLKDGSIVPIGITGEICVMGYQQMIGYLHDPDATARAVDAQGFVRTGDLGSMDESGYITLRGRLKEQIIRGGENISPARIETAVSRHPEVLEASAVGLPDARWGEIVACLVHLRGAAPRDLRDQLIELARQQLAPYMVPARWFVADEVPRTAVGKVRKFELAERISRGDYREL